MAGRQKTQLGKPQAEMEQFDFIDNGSGPAVLFIPGSFSTHLAWRGVQEHLPNQYRTIGTSLLGYGGSRETRTQNDLGMKHQVALINAVIARIDAPVHLVGHSFGGTIALATALKGSADIVSIATFEANPIALVRERGREDIYDDTRRISDKFEAALAAGEMDAPRHIIDFWDGSGAFARLPKPVQNYCNQTAPANLLDWYTAYAFKADAKDYTTLNIPVLLVRGELSNSFMREATTGLSECLPRAKPAIVPGASHSLIVSHAQECAQLLQAHLARYT